MALDPVTVTPPFVLNDKVTVTAIQANYAYLFEDRIELHVFPSEVPTLTIAFFGMGYVDSGTTIVLSALDTATITAATTLARNKAKARLENYPGP